MNLSMKRERSFAGARWYLNKPLRRKHSDSFACFHNLKCFHIFRLYVMKLHAYRFYFFLRTSQMSALFTD